MSPSPTRMKATMATTLMMANQYSNSAKLPTCIALMTIRPTETSATQTHCGTDGNHIEQ